MPPPNSVNRVIPAVVGLAIANAVMAISQANIASIYLAISLDFHSSLYGLGILSSSYFAGYVLVELPGGIVAARLGPKKLVLLGGSVTSLALLGCALSPDFLVLTLFRVSAGVGYGLSFASILVLLMRNLGRGAIGLGSALGTISFSLGASAGIYVWSILSDAVGWRSSLLVEFAMTLVSILALIILVPKEGRQSAESRTNWSQITNAMTHRPMIALAFVTFGGGATAILTGSFLVYYLEQSFTMSVAEAGIIGTLSYLAPLVTGIMAGKLYDRRFNTKVLIALSAVLLTIGTAAVAYHSVYAAIFGSVIAGLAIGLAGTLDFSVARDLSAKPEYESLNVAIADAASLGGLFVAPLFFSVIAISSGYPIAWIVGSLPAIVLFLPLLFVKIERRNVGEIPKTTTV
jgi:predicted MFS family arabinose efflux permease